MSITSVPGPSKTPAQPKERETNPKPVPEKPKAKADVIPPKPKVPPVILKGSEWKPVQRRCREEGIKVKGKAVGEEINIQPESVTD